MEIVLLGIVENIFLDVIQDNFVEDRKKNINDIRFDDTWVSNIPQFVALHVQLEFTTFALETNVAQLELVGTKDLL